MHRPSDLFEDLNPRNNEYTKAPLSEIKQLVPEVSLLLDQDINRSLHQQQPTVIPQRNFSQRNNVQIQEQKNILCENQCDSYNTWRAKHVKALHGMIDTRPEMLRKDVCNYSIRFNDYIKEKINGHTFHYNQYPDASSPTGKSTAPNKTSSSQENDRTGRTKPVQNLQNEYKRERGNGNISHYAHKPELVHLSPNDAGTVSKRSYSNQEVDLDHECYASQIENVQLPYNFNKPHTNHSGDRLSNRPINSINKPKCTVFNNKYSEMKDIYMFSKELKNGDKVSYPTTTPNCDTITDGNVPISHVQSNPSGLLMNTSNSKDIFEAHAIADLYHIVQLQNEKILILQQQIEHLNFNLSFLKSSMMENVISHKCSCMEKHKQPFRNDDDGTPNIVEKRTVNAAMIVDNQTSVESNTSENSPKRSIGVMTSLVEEDDQDYDTFPNSFNSNTQTMKHNRVKLKNQKGYLSNKSTSTSSNKQVTQNNPLNNKERGSIPQAQFSQRQTNNTDFNAKKKVDNSFYLNRDDILIEAEEEEDYSSANNSMHLDLPDYHSSSDCSESKTTRSSSDEDEASGTENEASGTESSSQSQLGWTFYNRFVGQVNNIMKKQEKIHTKNSTGKIININEDCETENNWSKRVTFDRPPLEDSDDTNVPRGMKTSAYHYLGQNKNVHTEGGGDMLHDFMMYNFANTSTNLSFATMRYLERYQLLPQQAFNIQDPVCQRFQQNNTRSKNKKKKSHK